MKTLTTGDLDYTQSLNVNNHVKMFKPGGNAEFRTVGGLIGLNYCFHGAGFHARLPVYKSSGEIILLPSSNLPENRY